MHCADKFLLKVFKVNITVVLLLYLKSIKLLTVYRDLLTTMASHGQKQGLCGVTYIGHYISTLYITYIRHYISALFNLSFMFIHCHKR